jgi:hypothetical protein
MTSKTLTMTASGPKKMDGWFSWRHRTREVHDRSREEYVETHATARARRSRKERRSGAGNA